MKITYAIVVGNIATNVNIQQNVQIVKMMLFSSQSTNNAIKNVPQYIMEIQKPGNVKNALKNAFIVKIPLKPVPLAPKELY